MVAMLLTPPELGTNWAVRIRLHTTLRDSLKAYYWAVEQHIVEDRKISDK